MRQEQIALQLYTVRDEVRRDLHATLRAVAAMGYPAVELVLGDHDDGAVRATLDDCGLVACAAHVPMALLRDRPDEIGRRLATLGASYAVLPWVDESHRRSLAAADAIAETLNRAGAALAAHGVRAAYHNHDFELRPLEGTTMWERLLAQTDPALVDFELDVYWAHVAGHDPAELLDRHRGRVPLVHCKDRAPGERHRDAPVGDGTLDWPAILAAAERGGARWLVAEQDNPSDALPDSERSLHALRRLVGAA